MKTEQDRVSVLMEAGGERQQNKNQVCKYKSQFQGGTDTTANRKEGNRRAAGEAGAAQGSFSEEAAFWLRQRRGKASHAKL